MAQQAQARAALHFKRNVIQCIHRLAEAEKTGRVRFTEVGYGDQIILACEGGSGATQLREPVENIQEEERVVSVAVS